MADNTETLGLRLHADGVVATSNGVKLAGDAIADLGKKADAANQPVARIGNTSKQTAAAMRQLPAQVTDIVTSLISGQPAYLVAIQQGGQLKDSFGGIGPAMRALLGYFSPMTLGLIGVGAAAGVAVAAFTKGQSEALGYRQAIVMTGNAAGVTTSQVSDMARGVSRTVGTQYEAAAAMTALIQTSQVAGKNLSQFGEVAVRMEQVTGQSVGKTAEMFAELGKRPVEASVRLNEQYNYLTLAVYKQIKALEEQKKYTEAGELAQKTFADAMQSRTRDLKDNLGTLERAWKAVGGAAKWTWDQMLGVGREATLTEQIAKAEGELAALSNKRVAEARQRQKDTQNIYQQMFPNRKISNGETVDDEKQALVEKIATLREAARMQGSYAQNQADAARREREGIEGEEKKKKAIDEGKSAYESLTNEIGMANRMALEELTIGAKLSEAEKFRASTLEKIAEQEKKLGPVRAQKLRDMAASTAAVIEELDWVRQANEYQQEHEKKVAQQREQKQREAQQGVETLKRERDAMFDQIAAIGANSEALAMREVSMNNAAIAQREARLAQIDGLPAYAAETAALREQIDLLNEKSALTMRKLRTTQADDERKANEKRTQDLAASIEEGIFNGFREGGKMADIFLRELKAQFARTVLRAPVQMIAQGGSDMLGKLFSVIGNVFGGGSANTDAFYPTDNTGARAWGGNAEPGAAYLVGKKGPEILRMGRQRGTVVPNHDLGRMGGGGPQVTFAPVVHIDSRTDRAEVMGLVGRAMRASQAELLEMMERRQA